MSNDPRNARRVAFQVAYERAVAFVADRALGAELGAHADAALDSLVVAAEEHAGLDDAMALVAGLGRRAGSLDATSTALVALTEALIAVLAGERTVEPERAAALRTICLEGYLRARDEARVERSALEAADAQRIVRVIPDCVAMFVVGSHDDDALERIVDRLGRTMLSRETRACVLDLGALADPSVSRALAVFSAHSTARMLGATCIFSSPSEGWLRCARDAGVDFDVVHCEPTFEAALSRALAHCDCAIRPTNALTKLFDRRR